MADAIADPAADTIFARASGFGRAGVAVFRISGPEARRTLEIVTCRAAPPARRAAMRRVVDPETSEAIDRGLAIFFPGPASFTGEDVAELHLHGSAAVEAAAYAAFRRAGARAAEPGEFTRRALLNGRLDLSEVEGLADLIDAQTEGQRRQALAQADGRLSAVADAWRWRLVEILAPLEAAVDFPDEEGVPADVATRAIAGIDAILRDFDVHRRAAAQARALREGVEVALIGLPNAGKSSLLNALSGTEAAIVSPIAGTTRDILEVRLDLGGAPAILADTAGLREETGDAVEAEGVRRARARSEAAAVRVLVVDPSAGIRDRDVSRETSALRPGDFIVYSRRDQRAEFPRDPMPPGVSGHFLSSVTGEGVTEFLDALAGRVGALTGTGDMGGSGDGALTRERHVRAVDDATAALARARAAVATAPELAAEDVRLAARALAAITGAVGVEDVLDEIFSRFCIGK